jgi:hypothetical protein
MNNQTTMKTWNSNFITRVVTTLAVLPFTFANPAQAYSGCYTASAANTIANMIRGGASSEQAVFAAIDKGEINSQACITETVGYMRSLPYVYGDVVR